MGYVHQINLFRRGLVPILTLLQYATVQIADADIAMHCYIDSSCSTLIWLLHLPLQLCIRRSLINMGIMVMLYIYIYIYISLIHVWCVSLFKSMTTPFIVLTPPAVVPLIASISVPVVMTFIVLAIISLFTTPPFSVLIPGSWPQLTMCMIKGPVFVSTPLLL